MGKERLRNLFRKNTLGEKMGIGKTSIAIFDLGKKNASAKRGGGNEKFGKYIALPLSNALFCFRLGGSDVPSCRYLA